WPTPSQPMARMFAIFITTQATMRGWMTTTFLILAITNLPEAVRPGADIFSSKTMVVEQQRNFSGRWKSTTGTVVTAMGALFPALVVIGSSRTRMLSTASSIYLGIIGHPNCECVL